MPLFTHPREVRCRGLLLNGGNSVSHRIEREQFGGRMTGDAVQVSSTGRLRWPDRLLGAPALDPQTTDLLSKQSQGFDGSATALARRRDEAVIRRCARASASPV